MPDLCILGLSFCGVIINWIDLGKKKQIYNIVYNEKTHPSTFLHIVFAGFDQYFKSLLPRTGTECENKHDRLIPHHSQPGKFVNCRNVWFREFWQQHHKCTFSNRPDLGVRKCTGDEQLDEYKQEGLVPFVGESALIILQFSIFTFVQNLMMIHFWRKFGWIFWDTRPA